MNNPAAKSGCDFDVAIDGYGPTGAVLANLLGARGWRVAVFDREPYLLDLPRAVHFDGEVMRVFQAAGLAKEIAGLMRPSNGMQYIDRQGRLMLERKPVSATGVHGWPDNCLFHQPPPRACFAARRCAFSRRKGLHSARSGGAIPG